MGIELFPLFLKLSGRRCVVVGAGSIGEGKIESLLRCDADVTVIAATATEKVRSWAAAASLRLHSREFTPADLDDAFLVIAATNAPELNHQIAAEARQRNILCNVVDDPDYCDFFYPAVVRRGALQIAISTAGASPSLARRLREQLESQFSPEYESWLEHIERRRREILESISAPEKRRAELEELSSDESFRRFVSQE